MQKIFPLSIFIALCTLTLAACDDATTHIVGATTSSAEPTASPTIYGTPAGSVIVGSEYTFHPNTTEPTGSTLTFSIKNKPAWTSFDASTGILAGTPTSTEVGTFADIQISVSDGGPSVELAPFTIKVVAGASEAVTLAWTPPPENTNGTAATDLTGYRIYYGATEGNLSQVVTVQGDITKYVFDKLPAGTWYFAVAAINSHQVESELSAVVPLTLTG